MKNDIPILEYDADPLGVIMPDHEHININLPTVFNTCTSQYEDIEVTKEVYNEFRRGEWRIEKNDDKHGANETPFSELIGGDDGAFENFQEFFDNQNTPELQFEKSELINFLYCALDELRYEDCRGLRCGCAAPSES